MRVTEAESPASEVAIGDRKIRWEESPGVNVELEVSYYLHRVGEWTLVTVALVLVQR